MSNHNQKTLFRLISLFTTEVLVGIISQTYITVGHKTLGTIIGKNMIIRFAEEYFNKCAAWIYSREESYINEKFDEMKSIPLENKNHPIDILHVVVMLLLACVNNIAISAIVQGSFMSDMQLIKTHIFNIISQYQDIAKELRGCSSDHIHKVIGADEKIFSFTLDKI